MNIFILRANFTNIIETQWKKYIFFLITVAIHKIPEKNIRILYIDIYFKPNMFDKYFHSNKM